MLLFLQGSMAKANRRRSHWTQKKKKLTDELQKQHIKEKLRFCGNVEMWVVVLMKDRYSSEATLERIVCFQETIERRPDIGKIQIGSLIGFFTV